MDGQRFDHLTRSLRTRRSALGLAAALGAALGLAAGEEAEAKCKKKCGPCKRCRRGKCRPKSGEVRCGPCSSCANGRCVARCEEFDCTEFNGEEICLKNCQEACGGCRNCDRVTGECVPLCEPDQCIGGFCRVPCPEPCGDCEICDFGECSQLCDAEICDASGHCNTCVFSCANDEVCAGGDCFPACDPACAADEGCVQSGAEHVCVKLAGTCDTGLEYACPGPESTAKCTAGAGAGRAGRCTTTVDGETLCAQGINCSPCETDEHCAEQGFGPNSRCVVDCDFCKGPGCSRFAGDG